MPCLHVDGKEMLLLVAQSPLWQDAYTVLKDGFMDGDAVYMLYDFAGSGVIYAADDRFEHGLVRRNSGRQNETLGFQVDGSPLPEPIQRFRADTEGNAVFIKCLCFATRKGEPGIPHFA